MFEAIDRVTSETILCKDISKHIWDSMKKCRGNARTRRQRLQSLMAEFETSQMKQEETVSNYFSSIMAVTNKLKIHGHKVIEITIIQKVLRSLTINLILLSQK